MKTCVPSCATGMLAWSLGSGPHREDREQNISAVMGEDCVKILGTSLPLRRCPIGFHPQGRSAFKECEIS